MKRAVREEHFLEGSSPRRRQELRCIIREADRRGGLCTEHGSPDAFASGECELPTRNDETGFASLQLLAS